MLIHVSDPAFVYDLICSFRQKGYSAAEAGSHTVEIDIAKTANGVSSRDVELQLAIWRSRHPGVVAEQTRSFRDGG